MLLEHLGCKLISKTVYVNSVDTVLNSINDSAARIWDIVSCEPESIDAMFQHLLKKAPTNALDLTYQGKINKQSSSLISWICGRWRGREKSSRKNWIVSFENRAIPKNTLLSYAFSFT